jgi:hypothetical protein
MDILDGWTGAPDGGLYGMGPYLRWEPGQTSATLDGEFTADELRAIADYMAAHMQDPPREPA